MNSKSKSPSTKDRKSRGSKTITDPEREIIIRVMKYFEEEKRNGTYSFPVTNVIKRTSRATGVSVSTVKRMRRELQASKSSSTLNKPKTPVGRGKNNSKQINYSEEILNGLKHIVDSYMEANGKMMSLNDTLAAAKKHLKFPGQRETLRKVLREKLGYVYDDYKNKHKRKKKAQSSTSESESDSDNETLEVLKNEYDVMYGTETANSDCGDPIMLCEVAIKEENYT